MFNFEPVVQPTPVGFALAMDDDPDPVENIEETKEETEEETKEEAKVE